MEATTKQHSMSSKGDDEDTKDFRRPSVQEAYASKIHAAKLHIAANAAYEAIQRVEAERAAVAAAANKKEGAKVDDDVVMDMSAEMSSAKFFRGSISEHSNDASEVSKEDKHAESPKRKSIVEGNDHNFNDVTPPELKRSRSEPRDLKLNNGQSCPSPGGGKGAVLGLIRARSESQRALLSLQEEDDESIRLQEEIHQMAEENRGLWDVCDAGRKNRAKPMHHTHITVVHETMVAEEEEDQDEAALGLVCFESQYHTAVVTVREGEPVVSVSIDKKNAKPITSMMAGLARSIPNQFTDYIHVKEATSDGFILAYRISPAIYRICGEAERVEVLRAFKKHLESIGMSLQETRNWLKKADTWNDYLDKETYSLSGPDCNSGLRNGRIEYLMMREQAESLEDILKKNAPSEIETVVTWEYEIS